MTSDKEVSLGVPDEVGEPRGINRRNLLQMMGLGLLPSGSFAKKFLALADQNPPQAPGVTIRQRQPANLESPFSALDGPITPTERHYVRSHFATPKLTAEEYRLTIEGAVDRTVSFTYEELRKMPTKTVAATMECAGNGRIYLAPAARGVQWEQGAVSTAEWKGVPLSLLLEKAGMKPGAVDIVFEGADGGEIKDPPKPDSALKFSRSIPVAKCLEDVLIVFEMNGKPLPAAHGFPVRAIVPGWYAVASIKWLTRIVVLDQPYHGFFETVDYAYYQRENGLVRRVPLTSLIVKSQIARPTFREAVRPGSKYKITGAAWTGEASVAKVEVSTDGGKIWALARLAKSTGKGVWQLWEYDWSVPSVVGTYALMSRATDSKGNVQSMTRDPDRENYMINHVVPIEVEVR